jgi:hypothetical protein
LLVAPADSRRHQPGHLAERRLVLGSHCRTATMVLGDTDGSTRLLPRLATMYGDLLSSA